MTHDANPLDDPADAAALRDHAEALANAVAKALPGWVERVVRERYRQCTGRPMPDELRDEARRAGREAVAEVAPRLRELLNADVEAQRSNPLAILRSSVQYPTEVLRTAGVPPMERDSQARALFPDDHYDLVPAAFADIDRSVHEPGLTWGAAKAHVILQRRRSSSGTDLTD